MEQALLCCSVGVSQLDEHGAQLAQIRGDRGHDAVGFIVGNKFVTELVLGYDDPKYQLECFLDCHLVEFSLSTFCFDQAHLVSFSMLHSTAVPLETLKKNIGKELEFNGWLGYNRQVTGKFFVTIISENRKLFVSRIRVEIDRVNMTYLYRLIRAFHSRLGENMTQTMQLFK